jgi:hypothetical protein
MGDKKATHIRQIEEGKKQILTERAALIASSEKRLGEIQWENEQKRTHLQDEHGNKVKECSALQKQYEAQKIEQGKLADQNKHLQGSLVTSLFLLLKKAFATRLELKFTRHAGQQMNFAPCRSVWRSALDAHLATNRGRRSSFLRSSVCLRLCFLGKSLISKGET